MAPRLLTKSKYLAGLQCARYLWTHFHEPDLIPEFDESTRRILDQGEVVGEFARKCFPGGLRVTTGSFSRNLSETRALLRQETPIFEAGLMAGRVFARADILSPAGQDSWDLIEVKSAASVKHLHIQDVAFQKYCYEQAGLRIKACYVMYLNTKYRRGEEIDHDALFLREDVTPPVLEEQAKIAERTREMLGVIDCEKCPRVTIGKQCRTPYPCPVLGCWDGLPEDSVFSLHGPGETSSDLFQMGVVAVRDIPPSYPLTRKQGIQRECARKGQPHVNRDKIAAFVHGLRYPLHYLDFETFSPAIPPFPGTRPYQRIPFQFSLHVVPAPGCRPRHFSFLSCDGRDPRGQLLSALRATVSQEGSVLAYGEGFERAVLRDLAETFPGQADWLDSVQQRIVDLFALFKNFHYYHPRQCGSTSLKRVLPVVTGSGYETMDIHNGQDASVAYQAIAHGNVSGEERRRVEEALKRYCCLDTEGMMWLVDRLNWIAHM